MMQPDDRRLTAEGVQSDLQRQPHLLMKLAENALTVAESLRDNYFKNTTKLVVALRKAMYLASEGQRPDSPLMCYPVGDVDWSQYQNEVVTFIDGGISVVALAGYTSDFQATIYSLIAEEIFEARVRNDLKLPVLLLLEEAHNFAPARAVTAAEQRAIGTTKQIAQEGRKFGVGLVLISQRPSRLDETTLSQCNSFIIMRMVNPADQSFVRKVVETLAEDEARMLPDLDVGEAILSGQLINFPVLVKIKQPESKGEREERDAFEVLEEAHASSSDQGKK